MPDKKGYKFIRYADALAMFVKLMRAGDGSVCAVTWSKNSRSKQIEQKSKMSPAKVRVVLGFKIHHKKLRALDSKVQGDQARAETDHSPISRYFHSGTYQTTEGVWPGLDTHHGCGLKYDDATALDSWFIKHHRMCYWKQWRRLRRIIRELIKTASARLKQ